MSESVETGDDKNQENQGSWFNFFFPNPEDSLFHGRLQMQFDSLEAVQKWVDGCGTVGSQWLRIGLAGNAPVNEQSRKFALLWLAEEERNAAAIQLHNELLIASNAAAAAQKAATWAKWAAVATAVGSLVTAVSAYISATSTPPPPQVFIVPSGQPASAILAEPQPPKK